MTRTIRRPNPKITAEAPCKCSWCHPRFWNSKAKRERDRRLFKEGLDYVYDDMYKHGMQVHFSVKNTHKDKRSLIELGKKVSGHRIEEC